MEQKGKPRTPQQRDPWERRGLPLDATMRLEGELRYQRGMTRVLLAIGIAASLVAIGCMLQTCNEKLADKTKAPMTETIRTSETIRTPSEMHTSNRLTCEI